MSYSFLLSLGKSDCPYYARSELLGDKLVKNLPDFQLHKIVIKPEEWDVSQCFVFFNLPISLKYYQFSLNILLILELRQNILFDFCMSVSLLMYLHMKINI